MDPRTVRAALLAALIAGGSVAFFGLFLGFPTTGTLVSAAVLGVLSAVLIAAASRRAETFETPASPDAPPASSDAPPASSDAPPASSDDIPPTSADDDEPGATRG